MVVFRIPWPGLRETVRPAAETLAGVKWVTHFCRPQKTLGEFLAKGMGVLCGRAGQPLRCPTNRS